MAGGNSTLNPYTEMSEEYNIWCIIPDGSDAFPVSISKNEFVDGWKEKIKKECPIKLNAFDASALSLHKIDVDISNRQHAIHKVKKLAPTLSPADRLNPSWKMSQVFPSGVPDDKIHILVELTEGESMDSRACGVLLMAGDIDAAWTQFNSRPPQLSGYRTRPWSTLQSSLSTSLTPK